MMPELNSDDQSGDGITPENTRLFGKYELGKLLGYGAFAKVYHGKDVNTGLSVAIKVVSKQKILRGGLMAHVKREISIMRRLHHPNTIKLFEVMATKTKIYFVMEFARGGELFAKVAKGRFSEDLCRRYFHQLISAVAYCHSRGVFHRDLKPENLLLDENWDLRIADFGLSALRDQIKPDGLLHTLCGTPAYVAPEILMKKGYDGAKVDIWSCGVVLYVLNAGYLPFSDQNLMVMYRKIFKAEFRCPKWTSPDLKRFLSRLLDANPKNRITIDEIVADPWFKKGYQEHKFRVKELSECDLIVDKKYFLNAFDIISYSAGVDLSGMFQKPGVPAERERFVSAETPEIIIQKIEEITGKMKEDEDVVTLAVMGKRDWGARLEGQNGNFVDVEIRRLTEKLVVVEIRRRWNIDDGGGDIWKDEIRPQLKGLIYIPEENSSPARICLVNLTN